MPAETLYSQIAEALRARVLAGAWPEGARLPSEPALCDEFGVSSITMRRAIATLVAEGLLVRLQGRGTFVASNHAIVQGPPRLTSFTEDMDLRGWRSSARVLSLETVRAETPIALRVGLAEGALVTRLRRVRLADGQPVALQVAHLPALLFPRLDRFDFGRQSLYEVMRAEYGIKPASATETYAAANLSGEDACLLEVPEGSAGFRGERVTSDSTGRRIELVESVIRGDRYRLSLRLSVSAS